MTGTANGNRELRVSADSHLSELPDLWEKGLPARYRDRAPRFPRIQLGRANHLRPGGWDPVARLDDMAADGISAEVERCRRAGLRGATIWIIPPEGLPFTSDHYERFWAAAQGLDIPVSMHI